MRNIPTLKFSFYGEEVVVTPDFGRYGNGRLAIMFDSDEGAFGTLTVNCPNDHLDDGEVFIKDWSENEALVLALIDAGWIKYTGREVSSGFVYPKVATLAGPLLEVVNFLGLSTKA
jgi:hypothetical protein